MCDMTQSYVCHDSFMCVTCLSHMCAMTHSCVWRVSFVCVTWHAAVLPREAPYSTSLSIKTHCNTTQHNATPCNTLQHTASHCNTLTHIQRVSQQQNTNQQNTNQKISQYLNRQINQRISCVLEKNRENSSEMCVYISLSLYIYIDIATYASHCNTLHHIAKCACISLFLSIYIGIATQWRTDLCQCISSKQHKPSV